jgi:hypothetical protein
VDLAVVAVAGVGVGSVSSRAWRNQYSVAVMKSSQRIDRA